MSSNEALRGEVIANQLNVRSGPGTTFEIVLTVQRGTVFQVLEQQDDWTKVNLGSREGYVASQFLDFQTDKSITNLGFIGFLAEQPELMTLSLPAPRTIPINSQLSNLEKAVARTWNDFGNLMEHLAELLTIPVGAVVGVLVAESGGRVFAEDGRLVIRFENHVFYSRWGQHNEAIFNRHFDFNRTPGDLWKDHRWRRTEQTEWQNVHINQDREWEVLTFARQLDDPAALMSISMGAPQIMGFNFKRLGYESVQEMFENFSRSAHAQLLAMFDFVKGSEAVRALQRRDFLTFASIYNGSGNAPTYEAIIRERTEIFERLILTAETQPAVNRVAPMPDNISTTTIFRAKVDFLNFRRQPVIDPTNIIRQLRKGDTFTILEPLDEALAKVQAGQAGGKYLNIRTPDGTVGFVAAWLTEQQR